MKRLSQREAQLVRLLVSAVAITRAELSREMGCSEATVVKHLKRIFAKTGKKTTLSVVVLVWRDREWMTEVMR